MRKIALWLMPLLIAAPALAQGELHLGLHRIFGFGWGSQIQGRFNLAAEADVELAEVTFWIDDAVLGTAGEPPFVVGFHTGAYSLGWHTFSAVAITGSGEQLTAGGLRAEFVSADAGAQFAVKMILPILGILAAFMLLGTVVPMAFGRGAFKLGQYGPAGGAVCPRCSLPFSRHFLSPNLLLGKLERCPHCGRWSIVARASPPALAEAEARWGSEGTSAVAESPDDRLQRQIDDSRYEDQ
jgi:hypothetical protein